MISAGLCTIANRLTAATRRMFGNGDISKGGGTFSKKEHAQEEQFFRKREQEELKKLKETLAEGKHPKDQPGKQQPKEGKK
jgi:hypothetical protein